MNVKKTALKIDQGYLFSSPVFHDSRGAFEALWEARFFASPDFKFQPVSANHSYNVKQGTIRAFHYQAAPHEQAKLVSCVSGRIWDVMVDLRDDSPTRHQWSATELAAGDGRSLFIPAGCAHGFATLENNTTVTYLIQGDYVPQASSVVRWNDPSLGVDWPVKNPILSEKDARAPFLQD